MVKVSIEVRNGAALFEVAVRAYPYPGARCMGNKYYLLHRLLSRMCRLGSKSTRTMI
jgi:hypothetical protein